MRFSLPEALAATGGEAVSGGRGGLVFGGVCTDTRADLEGKLFVALAGERFDGHDFIEKAVEGGAAGIVVSRGVSVEGPAVIRVADTLDALGRLGNLARRKAGFRLAAISGSFGKTTTKELVLRLLRGAGKTVLGTEGNLNNLVGLPLTLLGAEGDEELAVVELGISVPGEMERLSKICEPEVALLTGIGPAHTEGLVDVAGVAREKLKIAEGLKEGGVLLVPGGEQAIEKELGVLRPDIRVKTFGWDSGADYAGSGYASEKSGGSRFFINGRKVFLPLPGKHNASNAIAAFALASELGAETPAGEEIFGREGAARLRGEIIGGPSGSRILVDCYNANPTAVMAALDTLADLAGGAPKVLVLGGMRELGALSAGEHRKIGAYAVKRGVTRMILVGSETKDAAEGAISAGMDPQAITFAEGPENIAEELRRALEGGGWALVKGSRAHKLDLAVALIGPP